MAIIDKSTMDEDSLQTIGYITEVSELTVDVRCQMLDVCINSYPLVRQEIDREVIDEQDSHIPTPFWLRPQPSQDIVAALDLPR